MSKRRDPGIPVADVSIRFDTPGARAIGSYRAGVVYLVRPEEAERLVRVKGATVVTEITDPGPPESTEETEPAAPFQGDLHEE